MPRRSPSGRRRAWRGIRGRSTAVVVVVLAVTLLAGAAAFLTLLQRELLATARGAAHGQAGELAAQLERGGVPAVADLVDSTARAGDLIQVMDGSGAIVAASSRRAEQRPLTTVSAAPGEVVDVPAGRLPLIDDDAPYLLVVAGATRSGASYRVVVATSIDAQQESVATALSLLLIGLPLLLLLVGVATWQLVGRTLRPVEQLRRRVNEIGARNVGDRLTVPEQDDEIARLAITLNGMLERLDDASRAQQRFIADASHELRSPLSTLTASVELARADASGQTWAETSELVASEVDRMTNLVADLLLLAKADEHGLPLHLADVDLDDLVSAEARRLSAVTAARVELDAAPARLRGDSRRLAQVLANLGDNAARHARTRIRISLRVGEGGARGRDHSTFAVVDVDDDGPGIPEGERERVFERFVRLDDSRDRSRGGSGLGLAIVRELVRGHGGTVEATTSPLGGCRMELRLPLSPDDEGG
ncbi:MAG TPA: HAMP domain-containing sensor histidine kinase [Actinomycetales bacterium]|nr:HAMP domain-containing sensor histidine kinase [Actinomycetales bacterium]